MDKPKLMTMSPEKALKLLVPGVITVILLIGVSFLRFPQIFVLLLALLGFIPSAIVFGWGTIKFRSFYEVKRTRADLLVMVYATLIQILALGCCAYLFVQILGALDSIAAS